jgi:hypothetical protein
MSDAEEVLRRLARETGAMLGQIGVRSADERWLTRHADTVASLLRRDTPPPPARGLARWIRKIRSAAGNGRS